MSAPLSRKAPPDGGLAERSGEMGRKPALHSSCSKTGAKVGISMLIDKHCQLKSCNPCQPTRACMPHWAARRPQQAHGSPAPRTTPTHPHTTTPDSPTKDSKRRPRRQQSPTPPTLNETTTGHGRRNACGPAIKRPCSSDIGHNSMLPTSSPLSHIQQGESLVPARLITPHRGDYGYDIIPAHQKRPASDKASFFRRTWFGPATVIPTTSTQNY